MTQSAILCNSTVLFLFKISCLPFSLTLFSKCGCKCKPVKYGAIIRSQLPFIQRRYCRCTTLISIAIKYISLSLRQNTKCNFVTFWTSFYFHPVFVVAEQSMPACFQILRYLTGPLLLGILKKSCNVVQACLGNWQTWYFSAKIRQYWYWYWSTMQILIKQNSVQDSQKELLSIADIVVCLDNYWNHTLTGRSNFIGISLLPPVLILEAEGRCSLCQGGPTVQCRYKGRPYGAVL